MTSSSFKHQALRWALLAGALGAVYALAHRYGVADQLTVEGVRGWVKAAGPWGPLAFLAIYLGGVLLSIPGMVFIVSGMVAFGPAVGIPLTLVGSIVSGTLAVAFLERVGGAILKETEQPLVKRTVEHLHDRPLRTIAGLRMVLMISPVLNVALAMAGVRARDNAVGTAIGITPVVLVVALATDLIVAWVSR